MQKTFDELTSAEKTAAKRAAKKMFEEKSLERLSVCADPGNMPLSDINRAGYPEQDRRGASPRSSARVSNISGGRTWSAA